MKNCSKCERNLPLDAHHFYKSKIGRDGFETICKECRGYKFTTDKLAPRVGYKICSTCARELPLNTDYYNSSNKREDGLLNQCKECRGSKFTKRLEVKEGFKICIKCNKELPNTSEYFHKNTSTKDKLLTSCKVCACKIRTEYYLENKEKENTYDKVYRQDNKEKIALKKREWVENNKNHVIKYRKKYILDNKEKIEQYREANKEHIRDICREWEKKDRKENPGRYVMKTTIRRTRAKGLKATLNLKQWNEIKKDFDYKCAYCGMSEKEHIETQGHKLHREHFISLTDNGPLTHNNIIPSCRSCNSSKGNKSFFEWYPNYEHYNKKREMFILEYLNYKNEYIQQLALF